MLLCDVGNTSYHFLKVNSHFFDNEDKLIALDEIELDYKELSKSFDPSTIKDKVFYISVNPKTKDILKKLDNWIDLSAYVDMQNYYETMGIDRIVACESISNGLIIDAGSAITVDVVKNGMFGGGFIYPGLKAMGETYKNISSALDYSFNFELDLGKMPKNSKDAISYGYLKTLYCEVMSHNMEIYLTGGDAKEFVKIFPNAKVDEMLIFNGMKKIINNKSL